LFFQLLKQLAADPSYNKVISVGRRKVDLPSEPGMEKVVQEEVNFDNLSEYSSAFPRFHIFLLVNLSHFFLELIQLLFVWGQQGQRLVPKDL